jgi:hypothetical protein
MQIEKKETFGGYILELSPMNEIILSITTVTGETIKLNDTVVSNGRVFNEKGTKGRVVEIDEPHTNGLSNDVILVQFEDGQCHHMKHKDLEYQNGSYVLQEPLVNA